MYQAHSVFVLPQPTCPGEISELFILLFIFKEKTRVKKNNYHHFLLCWNAKITYKPSLRKNCLYSEFFWSVFSRIWTEYLLVFSLNAGKYVPKKLQIRTLFTQCVRAQNYYSKTMNDSVIRLWYAWINCLIPKTVCKSP